MGTPCRIHVDSTSRSHRYVEDQILTNFHVICTYFFDLISMIEKCASFPRTFFDVILLVEKSILFPRTFIGVISLFEKSTLFPHTFFRCNLSGRNIHVVFTYFFLRNFDGQKNDIVFGKLQANENIRGGFYCVCNFKQLTFARMFSLNFSSISPSSIGIWVSWPPPLQKEMLQVSFLGIYRTNTVPNNFWGGATLLLSNSCKKV